MSFRNLTVFLGILFVGHLLVCAQTKQNHYHVLIDVNQLSPEGVERSIWPFCMGEGAVDQGEISREVPLSSASKSLVLNSKSIITIVWDLSP